MTFDVISVREVAGVASDLTACSSESIFDHAVGFVGSGERWFRLSSPGRAGPREPRRAVLVAWRAGSAGQDMARLYGEPVEVQTGEDGLPVWFGWRRRRYAIHAVQEYWLVNRDWWRESNPVPARPELEYWRVEASAGQGHPAGIYELRRDVAAEVWTLRRVED
jgi:Family of unknown function (DUF6504)